MCIDRGINKEVVIYVYNGIFSSVQSQSCPMEYYSAIKNERMPFAATLMDPEIFIVSKLSQKEKEKYCTTSLICEF